MESFPASVPRLSPSFLTFPQTCSSIICNLLESEEETAAPWWETLPCDPSREPSGSNAGSRSPWKSLTDKLSNGPGNTPSTTSPNRCQTGLFPSCFVLYSPTCVIFLCKMLEVFLEKVRKRIILVNDRLSIKVTLPFPWIVSYQI